MRARNAHGGMQSWWLQPPISNHVARVVPPTTPHARCARNLEASQTQCEDPEGNPKSGLCGPIWLYTSLQRNLDSALDEEATRDSYGELAKDLVADDQPEALHVHVDSQLC